MKIRDEQSNYRYQGIAAALAELAGTHMEPGMALVVLESLDLTINDLEAAGADPYDLDMLKGAGKDANPLQYELGELAQRLTKIAVPCPTLDKIGHFVEGRVVMQGVSFPREHIIVQ